MRYTTLPRLCLRLRRALPDFVQYGFPAVMRFIETLLTEQRNAVTIRSTHILFGMVAFLRVTQLFCAIDGNSVQKIIDSEFTIDTPIKEPSWAEAADQENKIVFGEIADKLVAKGCVEVTPEVCGQLYQEIKSLADVAKIKMPRIVVIPRFSLFNLTEGGGVFDINACAMATPDGTVSTLCVGEAFVKNLPVSELKGILAHEVSHILLKHHAHLEKLRFIPLAVFMVAYLAVRGTNKLTFWGKCGACFGITGLANLAVLYDIRRLEKQADLSAIRLAKSKDLASGLERLERIIAKRRPLTAKILRILYKFAPFLLNHPATDVRKKYIEHTSFT